MVINVTDQYDVHLWISNAGIPVSGENAPSYVLLVEGITYKMVPKNGGAHAIFPVVSVKKELMADY